MQYLNLKLSNQESISFVYVMQRLPCSMQEGKFVELLPLLNLIQYFESRNNLVENNSLVLTFELSSGNTSCRVYQRILFHSLLYLSLNTLKLISFFPHCNKPMRATTRNFNPSCYKIGIYIDDRFSFIVKMDKLIECLRLTT